MSGDPIKLFGLVVKELRKERKISQEHLADEAAIDRTFLSQLETGRKQPSLLTILRLAQALRIEASELLQRVEAKLNMKDE